MSSNILRSRQPTSLTPQSTAYHRHISGPSCFIDLQHFVIPVFSYISQLHMVVTHITIHIFPLISTVDAPRETSLVISCTKHNIKHCVRQLLRDIINIRMMSTQVDVINHVSYQRSMIQVFRMPHLVGYFRITPLQTNSAGIRNLSPGILDEKFKIITYHLII